MLSLDEFKDIVNKRDIDYWGTHKRILDLLPLFIENVNDKVFYPANIFNRRHKFLLYFFSANRVEIISMGDSSGILSLKSLNVGDCCLNLKIPERDADPLQLKIKLNSGFEILLDALEDSMESTVFDYNDAIKAIYKILNK